MAYIEFHWTKTDPIRIDEFARDLGFNLRAIDYNGIPENQWNWIDGKIRNAILAHNQAIITKRHMIMNKAGINLCGILQT